jgi:hypothetical protein
MNFLSLKNDVNVPSKSNKHENLEKFIFYVLKVTDENSRILILIHTKISWIRNTAVRTVYDIRKKTLKFPPPSHHNHRLTTDGMSWFSASPRRSGRRWTGTRRTCWRGRSRPAWSCRRPSHSHSGTSTQIPFSGFRYAGFCPCESYLLLVN